MKNTDWFKSVPVWLVITGLAAGTLLTAQTSGVFFNEGWESGSAAGSFNSSYYGRTTESQYSVQNAIFGGGARALRHHLTGGQDAGSVQYATQHFGDARTGPVLAAGQGQHFYDLYAQWKVYYSAGFNFNAQYKQFIIGTEDDLNQTAACCNPWVAHYMTIFAYTGGVLLAEANNKQSANGQWVDFPSNTGGYSGGNPYRMTSGRWYTIEVRRRLNDIGSDNGIFQMWANGTLIADYRSVRFRVARNGGFGTTPSFGTNFAMISDWAAGGVPQDQDIYYDDVKFSTAYIGTGGTPPTGAPAPPTEVRIVR